MGEKSGYYTEYGGASISTFSTRSVGAQSADHGEISGTIYWWVSWDDIGYTGIEWFGYPKYGNLNDEDGYNLALYLNSNGFSACGTFKRVS